jgi:hypothetical protein
MPVDANVDGIHTGIRVDRDCEMALAEECKDAFDGVFPLPGSAMMNEGQQQRLENTSSSCIPCSGNKVGLQR